jgi:hypothetical protein
MKITYIKRVFNSIVRRIKVLVELPTHVWSQGRQMFIYHADVEIVSIDVLNVQYIQDEFLFDFPIEMTIFTGKILVPRWTGYHYFYFVKRCMSTVTYDFVIFTKYRRHIMKTNALWPNTRTND